MTVNIDTTPNLVPAGDQGISISFENEISERVHQKVMALHRAIQNAQGPDTPSDHPLRAVTELIPSYRSLLILYDGLAASYLEIYHAIVQLCEDLDTATSPPLRIVEIPTYYGGEAGPDLERVAKQSGLSTEEVIALHANKPYLVYMIGFIAGFPYLGGMDQRLATPRLEAPRKKIPAGSVGIAGAQTGVYPLSSPGGWNLIGQTAKALFDPKAKDPVLLRAGDQVVFKPVVFDPDFDLALDPELALDPALDPEPALAPALDPEPALAPALDPAPPTALDPASPPAPVLTVIAPGMQTSIQDLGRPGYHDLGISAGGAMDSFALKMANALVGNPLDYPGLEMLMSGPSLQFETDGVIAITGATMVVTLNDKPIDLWMSVKVKKGDLLSCGFATSGCRTYLSIQGGFLGERLFGSCSTAINIGIGGILGRALRKGDSLVLFDKEMLQKGKIYQKRVLAISKRPQYSSEVKLRVILGTQAAHFTKEGIETFLTNAYTMSPASDRMGTRLSGMPIEHSALGADILSDGIAFGAIQVPGDGQPIIMLADRQTIGGYAKIAHVITADHGLLAQCTPGGSISFETVTVEEAQQYLREQKVFQDEALESLENMENDDSYSNMTPRMFNIKINGKEFTVTVVEKVNLR